MELDAGTHHSRETTSAVTSGCLDFGCQLGRLVRRQAGVPVASDPQVLRIGSLCCRRLRSSFQAYRSRRWQLRATARTSPMNTPGCSQAAK